MFACESGFQAVTLKAKPRNRQEPSISRALILDATEQLMVSEGYAAVTTRRVASLVGLTAALSLLPAIGVRSSGTTNAFDKLWYPIAR